LSEGDSEQRLDRSGERGASGALFDALRAVLRPVVRLLLEKQVTQPVFGELLKEVMLEVVRDRFALADRRLTDSRISLLTGIHRKEIRRLRAAPPARQRASASVSLGALIVSRWTGDPRFLDASQAPRVLPRTPPADGGPSFEELVLSTSRDTTVRSVLDEWLRSGIVAPEGDDRLRLKVEAFVPARDFEDKLYFFGRNLRDHAAAGVHNLLDEGPPFFDRSVFYDRLSPASVEQLRSAASELGSRALREMNQLALELQRQDAERPARETDHRMTWGAYFFAAPTAASSSSGPGDESEGDSDE
jgi:hypothetical protein